MTGRTVLAFNPTSDFSGAERILLTLARFLPEYGWGMAVAVPGPGALAERLAAYRIPVLSVAPHGPAGTRASFAIRSLVWGVRLARLASTVGADLIHANGHMASLSVGIACRLGGLPGLVHLHGCPSTRLGGLFWMIGASVVPQATFVAVSHHVAGRWFRKRRGGVWVVHNGIDLEEFPWRGSMSSADPLIVNVGQLTPRKAQHLLLDALSLLGLKGLRPRVAFAGGVVSSGIDTGSQSQRYFDRLRQRVKELCLESQVSFLGEVRDIPGLLRRAVVMAHTALEEPLGIALQEAMAVGVPVVAPRVGGIPELIQNGETGLLYDRGDAEGLAAALARVLLDEGLAARLSLAARRRMEERFDARAMAQRMAQIYDMVGAVSGPRPNGPVYNS